jgi:phenylalanyl-tRNA synthetase beta subunit
VLAALRASAHPLAVAGIRDRLGSEVTGQQVRRILERAGSKVVASGERPIRYRLR